MGGCSWSTTSAFCKTCLLDSVEVCLILDFNTIWQYALLSHYRPLAEIGVPKSETTGVSQNEVTPLLESFTTMREMKLARRYLWVWLKMVADIYWHLPNRETNLELPQANTSPESHFPRAVIGSGWLEIPHYESRCRYQILIVSDWHS